MSAVLPSFARPIHAVFLVFTECSIEEWAASNLHEYRQANNKEEFCQEIYDEFVQQTFNSYHDSWYSNPRSLTFDDIQTLLWTHRYFCEHEKDTSDFIVPPPDCIHQLLLNYGYYNVTVADRDRLYAILVQSFQDLNIQA